VNLDGKRILVVKPSSLGDVVHTLPLVHAIKRCYPACRIGWIVQRGFSAIVENDPTVDETIPIFIPSTSDPDAKRGAFLRATSATLSTLRDLRSKFRRAPYHLVLDLHASFRSGLIGMTNPGGIRIGFADAKELNSLFQHRTLQPHPNKPHAVDKNLIFADFLHCAPEPQDFRVVTSPEARKTARSFLAEAGVSGISRTVYANPVARWATKLWTTRAWAELADLLIREARACVVFSGATGDVPYIGSITAMMKERALVAAGKLSLAEAVALLEAASVYVGVDSGPMHVAAFTGTPAVALFGPTDPAKVGPYGPGHRVLRVESLECLGCRKRACPDRRCMEGISPERVFRETVDLMGWNRY